MPALGVDDVGVGRRVEAVAQLRDAAVADEHVLHAVQARARIEHVRAADQQLRRRRRRGDERWRRVAHATGSGTGDSARAPASTS